MEITAVSTDEVRIQDSVMTGQFYVGVIEGGDWRGPAAVATLTRDELLKLRNGINALLGV